MTTPSTADIRKYLTDVYNDEEIIALCFDYFRDVYDNFANMTKGQKIQALLDHCARRERIPKLLAALQDDQPEQYRKRLGAVIVEIESPIHLEFVRVPEGEFLMGSDPAKDNQATDYEKPQHCVYVPEFYIGKCPITNDQYAAFVTTKKHTVPKHWAKGQIPANKGNHPVVNVTWKDAVAFCEWLRQVTGQPIRLPTEAEWEVAARGIDGRIYPWGNQAPDKTLCNFSSNVGDTTPVGQYPQGVSPFGALDMAGNVWEWTGSLWGKSGVKPYFTYPYVAGDGREDLGAPDEVRRVARGGNCIHYAWGVRCAVRYRLDPYYSSRGGGFRVVASPLHS